MTCVCVCVVCRFDGSIPIAPLKRPTNVSVWPGGNLSEEVELMERQMNVNFDGVMMFLPVDDVSANAHVHHIYLKYIYLLVQYCNVNMKADEHAT
jgi:hypothetical protein